MAISFSELVVGVVGMGQKCGYGAYILSQALGEVAMIGSFCPSRKFTTVKPRPRSVSSMARASLAGFTSEAVDRAESPLQGLTLLLASTEFQRR